ncbi:LytTR family DNA-binding domain-containing protein [Mangrovimonas sp. AS39]|uniref:LytR/AlgR family response regulator transcription factor n=1 Tax=Mangrovimonas futianensis TaxID=2895523 RepID=UPI001E365C03|nr:LytTR family DNA-binding domain-containing protein [Mangrovimonas futianensis]MCF1192721.1 LytTR family DNA-binding domain-containing protein [Mangrovimonas futianensis]MCF1196358.1 LytTR family DNA-binding domain-containing protein [Mangrovimonas futianensis]
MKAIIIDDEKRARHLLSNLITEHCPSIEEIYEASDLKSGVDLIKTEHPDIVFLDIEMPNQSGLDILEYFPNQIDFKIIFVTAYNQYAIEAFKLSAVDYLLKPVDITELKEAVAKAKEAIEANNLSGQLNKLRDSLRQLSMDKIALEIPKGILFTSHNDIVYFEADGMYTNVQLVEGKQKTICKPLKHFVEQLSKNGMFFKCHRSYFINLKYVEELVKDDGDYLLMSNQKRIPISKSKRDQFLEVVKETFM